jgi:hypothetical protein
MICALLIHPYIMYMVMVILAAAPLSLLVTEGREWIVTGAATVVGVAVTGGIALLLGYGRALPMAGFGYHSMNLLSPIYPFGSSILKGFTTQLDATGGQTEGYQYLGLGLIGLIVACDFCLGPREKLRVFSRHTGLVVACLAMTLLALLNKVYAGHDLVAKFGGDDLRMQFRVSGRFFWVVTYMLLIGSTALVCRSLPRRLGFAIVLILALLQFFETDRMRRVVRHAFRSPAAWTLDTNKLRPLLKQHSILKIWPEFRCGVDHGAPPFLQLTLLASEIALPVNTTYAARVTEEPTCDAPIQVRPGELLALLPPRGNAMSTWVQDWREVCKQLGDLVACSQQMRSRSDLPSPRMAALPLNSTFITALDKPGLEALGSGWSIPEPWGIWSDGQDARFAIDPDTPKENRLVLRVWAHSLAATPGGQQTVNVWINGQPSVVWQVNEVPDGEYTAILPPIIERQSTSRSSLNFGLRIRSVPRIEDSAAMIANWALGCWPSAWNMKYPATRSRTMLGTRASGSYALTAS